MIELDVQLVGVDPASKLSLIRYVCPKPVEANARRRAKAMAAKPPRTDSGGRPSGICFAFHGRTMAEDGERVFIEEVLSIKN